MMIKKIFRLNNRNRNDIKFVGARDGNKILIEGIEKVIEDNGRTKKTIGGVLYSSFDSLRWLLELRTIWK